MPPSGGRGCGDCFCAAARHIAFFKKNAAFRRQGMRGIRPRAAGPFSDARKGTKSAFKGRRPLKNPAPPDKRSCSGLICTLGCPQAMVGDVQRCSTLPFLEVCRKRQRMPGPVRGSGSFCAAAQHLTFLRCVPRTAQDARSRPGGRLVFCLCKKQGKKHT